MRCRSVWRRLRRALRLHALLVLLPLLLPPAHASKPKDLIGWQGETHSVADTVDSRELAASEAAQLMKWRSERGAKAQGEGAGERRGGPIDAVHHDAVLSTSFVVGARPKHPSHHGTRWTAHGLARACIGGG